MTPKPGLVAGVVAVALIGLLGALLGGAGYDIPRAGTALIEGSLGSWYAFGSGTLVRATPLMLTGLAVALAFRGGMLNIGAEGQLLVGAAAGVAVALRLGGAPRPLALVLPLVAGTAAGVAWSGVAAILRARFHVLEVISTILLNFVAADLVSYLVRGPLQEPLHIYPQTSIIDLAAQLPRFGSVTRLHVGFVLAVMACLLAGWMLRATAAGFRLRAVGANPRGAAMAGQIDVSRVATRVLVMSGAIAGLAGAIQVSGVTYALYENISPGYGYTAIAVALLARLNPIGVVLTAIFFGALETGATAMQRDAGIPAVVVSVVEAAIILIVVIADRVHVEGTGRP